jgi:cytochrome c oxidase subunit II
MLLFIIVVITSAAGFVVVILTTRMRRKQTFASKRTYRFESYWAIGTAIILIWLWITSYPWMPPVSFSSVQKLNANEVQTVHVTAGQWFWLMSADTKNAGKISPSTIRIDTNKPVKFIARSLDVNHGFAIFESKEDGAPVLLQMQIVPGVDNVFYYTFTRPGTYFVRCLEYCGFAHPYMTTIIEAVANSSSPDIPQTHLTSYMAKLDLNSLLLAKGHFANEIIALSKNQEINMSSESRYLNYNFFLADRGQSIV